MYYIIRVMVVGWQRLVSPFLGDHCRFAPSCSQYFLEAVGTHGVLHGSVLGISRIFRCCSFFEGGFDPVPEPQIRSEQGSCKKC